jgi:VIT1/CCC1 family predicted Fe2+/Mn2+ transporter
VDAVLYVLNSLFERGRRMLIVRSLRSSPEEGQSLHLLADALPDGLAEALTADELNALGRRIAGMPDLPERPGVHVQDLLGAVGVFLLVAASTFPVSLPFLLIPEVSLAMRISRGLSLVLVFVCGYAVGRYSGLRAVPVGLTMLGIGAALVAVLTALGG